MGFVQLFVSLWPFLKEIFVGDRINDSASSRNNAAGNAPNARNNDRGLSARVAHWCIDKMQKSRRFLAIVILLLIFSVFINYKVIGKLSAIIPRDENQEKIADDPPMPKGQKEVPTVPRPDVPQKDTSDRDVLYNQTMRELKNLYGGQP